MTQHCGSLHSISYNPPPLDPAYAQCKAPIVCKCDPRADRPALYNPAVTTPVVEIEKLSRRFGTFTAVDSLTLVANAGEVFGLLGSNGAGKSTTIKMLTTLLPPSSGEARVGGFSITTQPAEVRRAIGYVPQAVSVDGSLTGYENLLIFAKLYDIPRSEQEARIREHLTFVDLTADAGRLVSQYSGGMVRRLEIAQATLHRPRVLFLDWEGQRLESNHLLNLVCAFFF